MGDRLNEEIAERLDEVANLLEQQGANRYRVHAYRNAATILRRLAQPVADLARDAGVEGLKRLAGVGDNLARTIHRILTTGRLPMLDRLRGESDPAELLSSVPGIGRISAERIHEKLGIETLEELETAAYDGRLASLGGIAGKRLEGIRHSLAMRLGRVREPLEENDSEEAPVNEILAVDKEYRLQSAAGTLPAIAPRRFNPDRKAWLPVLHATRGDRHYTALFSNTAHAHRMRMTMDWVVIYYDGGGRERQCTVITSQMGSLKGKRIVRGREGECASFYAREPARHGLSSVGPHTKPLRSSPS